LLSIGIVLSSVRALILLGFLAFFGAVGLVMMLASTGERGDDAVALLVIGGLAVLFCSGLAALELLLLCVCLGAWLRSRACVWALLVLCVLSLLLPPGPFRTPIAIVTLIGCILALGDTAGDTASD